METPKEQKKSFLSSIFSTKYRLIPVYKRYNKVAVLVQFKLWYFPFWIDAWNRTQDGDEIENSNSAVFDDEAKALEFIQYRRNII